MRNLLFIALVTALASPAVAGPKRIKTEQEFTQLIVGRDLTNPAGTVRADPGGKLRGTIGGAKIIGGGWNWQQGYFCRALKTAKREWPSECQLVRVDGKTLTFTGQQGKGETSSWTIN